MHSSSVFSGAENPGRLDTGYSGNNIHQSIQIQACCLKSIFSLHFLVGDCQHALYKITISQNAFITLERDDRDAYVYD